VDNAVIEPLTDYIWLGTNPPHDSRLLRVARVFQSLAVGLRTLDEFYQTVPIMTKSPLAARLFPHVCSYPSPKGHIRFRYLSKLAGGDPEKAIFKAKREQDNQFIVVKFALRYNADAHQAVAAKGLAPKLFHAGDTYQSIYSSRGLYGAPQMIVMEHLPGSTAHELFSDRFLPSYVFTDVQAAINTLHEKDIVFGDLRRTNIMVNKKRAKIVDFDWCGRDGEDRYPLTLNDTITWHPDVKRGSVTQKEHGQFMLKALGAPLTDIGENAESQHE